jgi:hypothetical protein
MASCSVAAAAAAFIILAVLSLTANAGPQSNTNDDAGNTPFINNRCVDDEGQPQVKQKIELFQNKMLTIR